MWKYRVKAAIAHLLVGLLLVGLLFLFSSWVWFPYPFSHVAGGVHLFILIATVDVVMGPLLTFVIFNRRKPHRELRRDLTWVVCLQLCALAYGIWTMAMARPVYLVHEVDRFQVITAADVYSQGDAALKSPLPWKGYQIIGVRQSTTLEEKLKSIDLAIQGQDLAFSSERWIPLNNEHLYMLSQKGHDLTTFMRRHPSLTASHINEQLAQFDSNVDDVRVYPLIGRIDTWSLMFDLKQRIVVGYLPVEGF